MTTTTPATGPAFPASLPSWIRLAHCYGLGPILTKRLLERLGSPEAVLAAHPGALVEIEGIKARHCEGIAKTIPLTHAHELIREAQSLGITYLCPDSPNWPAGFRHMVDPPVVLTVRGEILPTDTVALSVVGSRRATLYGIEQAGRFGALAALAGMTIVSGGARGIDTAAHEGALRAGGRTIVVQGCGLKHCYPPENEALYERIVSSGHGAVISELPLNAPPLAEHFPARNRLIAVLGLGVLVVEANKKSGSLITARLAAEDYGREVFALPGRVDSISSAGTHELIKSGGAHLVEDLGDILDQLGETGTALLQGLRRPADTPPAPRKEKAPKPLLWDSDPKTHTVYESTGLPTTTFTQAQEKILTALRGQTLDVDSLCEQTDLPPNVLMAELTYLQIRGAISRAGSNCYGLRQPTREST